MEYRLLGRTGVRVSALGFGCGDVGGLMVRGAPADRERGVARSLETSLGRLGLERVDLLHLHNLIGRVGEERPLGVARVLEAVVPAVRRLQEQGKVRFFGVTASGETGALHRALASGAIDTAQAVFTLLNPSGAYEVPAGYPAQDYDRQ